MEWIANGIKMWYPNSDWDWGCGNNKRVNQTWLAIQHWWHGPIIIKQQLMPLAFKNVTWPWHIELSHAPGTFECSHWCSPCKQSAQKLQICSHGGVWGYLSLSVAVLLGWVFLLGKSGLLPLFPWENTGSFEHTALDVPYW